VLYSSGEGLWRTKDRGITWNSLNDNLPSPYISSVIFSPGFAHNRMIFAGSSDGILISNDAGDTWQVLYGEPVNHLAISPSGNTLLAGTAGQGVLISKDSGNHWGPLPGPWEIEGDIQEIAVSSDNQFFIASIDPTNHNLEIAYGKPGQWHRIINQPAKNELVTFWIPPTFNVDNLWYASAGTKVWRIGLKKDTIKEGLPIKGGPVAKDEPPILALNGARDLNNRIILVSAGSMLYRSEDGITWQPDHDFEDYRVINIIPSPSFRENKAFYTLTLGGQIWRGIFS